MVFASLHDGKLVPVGWTLLGLGTLLLLFISPLGKKLPYVRQLNQG